MDMQATLAIRADVPLAVQRDVIRALPYLFGDLRGRAEGAARPDQGIAMRHPDIGDRASGHRIVPMAPDAGCAKPVLTEEVMS